jgi:hypothetical protein
MSCGEVQGAHINAEPFLNAVNGTHPYESQRAVEVSERWRRMERGGQVPDGVVTVFS